MNRKNVTLRPVRDMCKKLYYGKSANERRSEIERTVMIWKEDDAHRQRERTKRRVDYEWREGSDKSVLNKYKITEWFKRVTTTESEKELKRQRETKDKKIKFLISKEREESERRIREREKHNCVDVNDLCRSINTAKRPIPAEYSREPRIYGGAIINEEEKATLKLPPKFTLYENINKQQCFVEIETAVSKYLWTLRKENDDEVDFETEENIECGVSEEVRADIDFNATVNTSERRTDETSTSYGNDVHLDYTSLNESTSTYTRSSSSEGIMNGRPTITNPYPTEHQSANNLDSVANRTRSQTRILSLHQEIQDARITDNSQSSATRATTTVLLTPTPHPLPVPTPATTPLPTPAQNIDPAR
ncbi:MAG: hypothetical protein GY694_11495, partial [Gammaproteobacteria bacterium]|nr:hypothetical protein [Gammaproteobacteria bacterium]